MGELLKAVDALLKEAENYYADLPAAIVLALCELERVRKETELRHEK